MNLTKTFATLLVSFLAVALCSQAFGATEISLQQAVKEGKVEVDVSALGGAAGNTIRVNVKRKVPEELHISVTPGTVFIAKGGKVQNMTGGKIKGEFIWHRHDAEDEMFLVLKGNMRLEFHDRTVELTEGECLIVPRGVEHKPVADEEAHLLMFEPVSTLNTGNVRNEQTLEDLERL